jgi:hypothetical protein
MCVPAEAGTQGHANQRWRSATLGPRLRGGIVIIG